ncbi:hypothetical protein N865_07045 [Intrasporangium oryzae NRRL B-24470]|uniref:Uncharacterized protein n=1 Tax=Intrasporangium oryzae NRRL B-24470 TaxID=1386089 RepID=W9GA51_9MICO|nr:hypothetical protein [Intrasporangium oryzae]EWT02102.1 hypothetical protein N865_07045 [Intrasporangium oryzae NRRL B-24470]
MAMWKQAPGLTRAAFVWVVGFGVLATVWYVAEVIRDPGGVAGGLLSAAVVAAIVLLTLVVLRLPDASGRILDGAVVVVVALAVLGAFTSVTTGWGPGTAVAAFVVAVPIAFLGLREPRHAAILLLVAGVAPLLERVGRALSQGEGPVLHGIGGSAGAVALPLIVGGVLFLLAGRVDRRML